MENNEINKDLNSEIDVTPSPLEQFLIKISDMKQSMGMWYTLFGQKIIPLIVFFIPINVLIGRFNIHILSVIHPIFSQSRAILLVMWMIGILGLLALTIITPKVATVVEYAIGLSYLFLVFRLHLYNTVLGYAVLFSVILFLLVKTVFLVFEIIRLIAFSGDKKNNIERDESGRIVRASKEELFFNENKEEIEISESGKVIVASNSEILATHENAGNVEDDAPLTTSDDVYFSDDKDHDELGEAPMTDDDFFFARDNGNDEEVKISESDNDYFFG